MTGPAKVETYGYEQQVSPVLYDDLPARQALERQVLADLVESASRQGWAVLDGVSVRWHDGTVETLDGELLPIKLCQATARVMRISDLTR